MNTLSDRINHYLIVIDSTDYLQQMYKLCLQNIKNGCIVLIISSEYYDFSQLLIELNISKDQLKNFIIMYYKTFDDISRKLLLLHSWSIMPSMVVVDLQQLLCKGIATGSTSASLMQKITLCTVSLLSYLQSVAVQVAGNVNTGNFSKFINGLLILRSVGDNISDTYVQTLKDLYFYKTNLYHDFDDVTSLLMKEEGKL